MTKSPLDVSPYLNRPSRTYEQARAEIMPTQKQMYYAAESRSGRLNELFMDMVRDGMTNDELQKLIAKRPAVYGRFSGFLGKLK